MQVDSDEAAGRREGSHAQALRRISFNRILPKLSFPIPTCNVNSSHKKARDFAIVAPSRKPGGGIHFCGAIWRYRTPRRMEENYFSSKVGTSMTDCPNAEFSIRRNPDGSLDAICLKCFLTAGTTFRESELPAIEDGHQCDASLVIDTTLPCWNS
jgi:hypothetical protein